MNTELTTTLAAEILSHHRAAEAHAENAKDSANEALSHAVQCGNYLEQAREQTRGQMLGWLRDNVPGITPERAKAYMSLFHTHQERECQAIDHRQLIMLGIVDAKEAKVSEVESQGVKTPKVSVWAGSIRSYIDDRIKAAPIETWTVSERRNLVIVMKPVMELFNQINNTLDSDCIDI